MIKAIQEIKGNRNQSRSVNKLIATLKNKCLYFILSIYLSMLDICSFCPPYLCGPLNRCQCICSEML